MLFVHGKPSELKSLLTTEEGGEVQRLKVHSPHHNLWLMIVFSELKKNNYKFLTFSQAELSTAMTSLEGVRNWCLNVEKRMRALRARVQLELRCSLEDEMAHKQKGHMARR